MHGVCWGNWKKRNRRIFGCLQSPLGRLQTILFEVVSSAIVTKEFHGFSLNECEGVLVVFILALGRLSSIDFIFVFVFLPFLSIKSLFIKQTKKKVYQAQLLFGSKRIDVNPNNQVKICWVISCTLAAHIMRCLEENEEVNGILFSPPINLFHNYSRVLFPERNIKRIQLKFIAL